MHDFANLGEINKHLQAFQHSLEAASSCHESLAATMLVIMVRSLFTQLEFPYVQFSSAEIPGNLPFWKAIECLERCQLKVLAATADGASMNHKLFSFNGMDQR